MPQEDLGNGIGTEKEKGSGIFLNVLGNPKDEDGNFLRAEVQAREMIAYILKCKEEEPDKKVCFIYPANLAQTKKMYTDPNWKPSDSSMGIAPVFKSMRIILEKEFPKLKNEVLILPITTCVNPPWGIVSKMLGDERKPPTSKQVENDLKNIRNKLKEGNIVIIIQDEEQQKNNIFGIGNGVAKKVFEEYYETTQTEIKQIKNDYGHGIESTNLDNIKGNLDQIKAQALNNPDKIKIPQTPNNHGKEKAHRLTNVKPKAGVTPLPLPRNNSYTTITEKMPETTTPKSVSQALAVKKEPSAPPNKEPKAGSVKKLTDQWEEIAKLNQAKEGPPPKQRRS